MSREMQIGLLQGPLADWPMHPDSAMVPARGETAPFQGEQSNSLASILFAIQQKHGELYMLETARYLIEKWDLRFDQLQDQRDETLNLVARLLKNS